MSFGAVHNAFAIIVTVSALVVLAFALRAPKKGKKK
jgi:hypothetical protein